MPEEPTLDDIVRMARELEKEEQPSFLIRCPHCGGGIGFFEDPMPKIRDDTTKIMIEGNYTFNAKEIIPEQNEEASAT